MSLHAQMLFSLFNNFFTAEEMEWLVASLENRGRDITKCEHCIQVALNITNKMSSPLGMQRFSEIQTEVEKGIDADIAELEAVETRQLGKLKTLLAAQHVLIAMTTDAEERKVREAELADYQTAENSIKEMVGSSKKALLEARESSRLHLNNLWSTLAQIPGKLSN